MMTHLKDSIGKTIGSRDAIVQISLLRGRCDQRQSSYNIDTRGRW